MKNELYLIRFSEEGCGVSERYFTDGEHLQTCVEELRRQHPSAQVHVNQAIFCFDGYLVAGIPIMTYAPLGENWQEEKRHNSDGMQKNGKRETSLIKDGGTVHQGHRAAMDGLDAEKPQGDAELSDAFEKIEYSGKEYPALSAEIEINDHKVFTIIACEELGAALEEGIEKGDPKARRIDSCVMFYMPMEDLIQGEDHVVSKMNDMIGLSDK